MTPTEMAARLVFHVKQAAIEDLQTFYEILAEQNEVMNLVGPATLPDYWSRHVLDSAQLLDRRPDARRWADLGAGAGFPGLVLAILLKHSQGPEPCVWLVESLIKRCRFLQMVVDRLELPAKVVNERAEKINLKVDVVTARAVAPMTKLLGFAETLIGNGADAWFLKGENVESELAEAGKSWHFDVEIYDSLSDPRGRLIHIERLRRAR
ncbi:16S rRNA (guanine(527)-N(7))-methyltransferase RsmG [Asticcacaulis sp. EMRT-3]|uniref:16S rRNA (guanine(527)-N(7))-methyltransferase RsmG n=1 Tax=Asticcacaulis sp. EMRT-3 TaxID=3040349 RepID=UPI0024AFDD78|nr:16S rRNA (guanine(527)-N(7))-methyltransferase RsmG [Asticcacaulis sp. EMRT-3]MDI7775818.1 16S rRNA (guanine(527)-N(7))-methyltransferase RsmG [Asticcacaulis sp. EMRT-3]